MTVHGAEHAEHPSRDEPVPVEELARRKGVRPVESVDDMVRPELFEPDEEWQESWRTFHVPPVWPGVSFVVLDTDVASASFRGVLPICSGPA